MERVSKSAIWWVGTFLVPCLLYAYPFMNRKYSSTSIQESLSIMYEPFLTSSHTSFLYFGPFAYGTSHRLLECMVPYIQSPSMWLLDVTAARSYHISPIRIPAHFTRNGNGKRNWKRNTKQNRIKEFFPQLFFLLFCLIFLFFSLRHPDWVDHQRPQFTVAACKPIERWRTTGHVLPWAVNSAAT